MQLDVDGERTGRTERAIDHRLASLHARLDPPGEDGVEALRHLGDDDLEPVERGSDELGPRLAGLSAARRGSTPTTRSSGMPNSSAASRPNVGTPTTASHDPDAVAATANDTARDIAATPPHATALPRTSPPSGNRDQWIDHRQHPAAAQASPPPTVRRVPRQGPCARTTPTSSPHVTERVFVLNGQSAVPAHDRGRHMIAATAVASWARLRTSNTPSHSSRYSASAESGSAQPLAGSGLNQYNRRHRWRIRRRLSTPEPRRLVRGIAGDEHRRSRADGGLVALDERAERPAVVTVPVAGDHPGHGHEQPRIEGHLGLLDHLRHLGHTVDEHERPQRRRARRGWRAATST